MSVHGELCRCPRRLSLMLCHALLAGSSSGGCLCWGQAQTRVSGWKPGLGEGKPPQNTSLQVPVCCSASRASQPPATVRARGELAGHQHWSNWCKELGAAAGTGAGDSTQCQPCHLCPMVLHPPLPPISHPPGSARHLLRSPCPTRAACSRKAGSSEGHHSVQQCCFHPARVHLTAPAPAAMPREGRCPAAAPWRHKRSGAWAFSRAEPAHVAGARL